MKIQGNKPPDGIEINLSTQKISQAQKTTKTGKSDKTLSSDKVRISEQGKKIAELMSAIDQLPEIREEKIREIKDAIESGTYQIDPYKIAQKLIEEA
ncbi:MAG: flagellar biosynthesis anti-sigma factor FlgM [Thermodesulfovibrionales bacterium]